MLPLRLTASPASAFVGASLFVAIGAGPAHARTWLDYDEDFRYGGTPYRRLQNVAANYVPGPNPQPQGALATTLGANLLPYRIAASGDSALARSDDSYSPVQIATAGPEGIKLNMPVFGNDYSQIYVNTNGALSFGAGVSAFEPASLQNYRGGAMLAPFWADIDTTGGGPNGGNTVYYRNAGAAELPIIGTRIASAAGLAHFSPTTAFVATWDRVGAYFQNTTNVSTFQAIVASDGLQTYTLFLYPNRAIWWDHGSYNPPGTFSAVGVTDGLGGVALDAVGSRTAGVRDLWFLSNTADSVAGNFVFQINDNTSTLAIAGDHTLPVSTGAAAGTVALSANPAGHVITATASTGSLLFNALRFDNPADSATFTDKAVVLANAADAIVHGNLAFTDNTVLVARAPRALNGGVLTLAKSAKLALYAPGATTSATTLRFDNTAGSGGGTFDLRGFSATIGGIASANSDGGVITNSGSASATLTTSFDTATHAFGGALRNGTGTLALAKAGTGTLVLSGANTFTGGLALSGGAVELGSASALGTAGAITFAGGALRHSAANTTDYSTRFSTAPGQAYRLDTNGQNVALATALASSGGSLTKLGAGTLTLSAPATYSGDTIVSAGTLRTGAAGVLSPSSALFLNHGSTLDLAGHDQTVGDFDSYNFTTGGFDASTVLLGGGTVTNKNRVTNNWHGSLTGTGAFIKQGSAAMNWYGANTFAGTLRVDAGKVATHVAGSLSPNAAVQLAAGASLELNNHAQAIAGLSGAGSVKLGSATLAVAQAADATFSGEISGAGRLVKSGPATLALSGANTYSGGTVVQAGTLRAVHVNAFGTGALEISGGVVDFNGLAIANPITNRGGTLTGLANYVGAQTVVGDAAFSGAVGGSLDVADAASLDSTGATFTGPVTVRSGGTLSGTGTLGAVTIASGGTLSPGNSPGLITLGEGSILSGTTLVELGGLERGAGYDAIDVRSSGGELASVTVGGTLDIVLFGGWTPDGVASFQILQASSIGGTFARINLPAIAAGYEWNTDRLFSSGYVDIVASAVPEPASAAALAGLAFLGFAATRRRR